MRRCCAAGKNSASGKSEETSLHANLHQGHQASLAA